MARAEADEKLAKALSKKEQVLKALKKDRADRATAKVAIEKEAFDWAK